MCFLNIFCYLAGLSNCYCHQEIFEIGSHRDILFNKDQQAKLSRVYYGFVYTFAIFTTALNTSHWLFAMQYWSLASRLETVLTNQNLNSLDLRLNLVFYLGLLFTLATGSLIVAAYYKLTVNIENWVEILNIAPPLVSVLFLVDAMRRLQKVIQNKFAINMWQIIVHMISFVFLIISAIVISYDSRNTWHHPRQFFILYEAFILCIFTS